MKLAEALELLKDPEALRIRAAVLDGWTRKENKHGLAVILSPHGDELWHYDSRGNSYGPAVNWDSSITKMYLPKYNTEAACLFAAERRLGLHDRSNTRLRVQWVNYLHDLMGAQPSCPVNKVGTPVVSDIDKLLASVEVRCLAFVMAAEWKNAQRNTTT